MTSTTNSCATSHPQRICTLWRFVFGVACAKCETLAAMIAVVRQYAEHFNVTLNGRAWQTLFSDWRSRRRKITKEKRQRDAN